MNGKSYLLDTNAVIALFEEDPSVEALLQGAQVIVSIVVLGELFYGASKSARVEQNVERIETFASAFPVLNCDSGTARIYGEIKFDLRRRGEPIPENDLWIAAMAKQYGLTVLTQDGHFRKVEGLEVESW